MNSSAQGRTKHQVGGRGALPALAPTVQCDLCDAPMAYPAHLLGKPLILGLLTCSQCVEDNLATRQLETQP